MMLKWYLIFCGWDFDLSSFRDLELLNEAAHCFVTFSSRGLFGGSRRRKRRKSAQCKLQHTSVTASHSQEGALFLFICVCESALSPRLYHCRISEREWKRLLASSWVSISVNNGPLQSLFRNQTRLCSENGGIISSKSLILIKNNELEVLWQMTISPEWHVMCSATPDFTFVFSVLSASHISW